MPQSDGRREIHYTFVYRAAREDELLEGEFEDGLTHLLETLEFIENPEGTPFEVTLFQKLISEEQGQ